MAIEGCPSRLNGSLRVSPESILASEFAMLGPPKPRHDEPIAVSRRLSSRDAE
jgi:hypothetical protein